MCENHSDLGRQEPRGCRYVYGDPGAPGWHYCQRSIAEGGKPGDAAHPPYCTRHTKVALEPISAAKAASRARYLERLAMAEETVAFNDRDEKWALVAADSFIKINLTCNGLNFAQQQDSKGFSHD